MILLLSENVVYEDGADASRNLPPPPQEHLATVVVLVIVGLFGDALPAVAA